MKPAASAIWQPSSSRNVAHGCSTTLLKKSARKSSAIFRKSNEYDRLFEEFIDERDMEITEALESAIETHGYHHVLAALESGEVSDVCAGSVYRDLAGLLVEDFEKTHGWEIDPIEEMEDGSESAAETLVNVYGGHFDEQGNYVPQAGANC